MAVSFAFLSMVKGIHLIVMPDSCYRVSLLGFSGLIPATYRGDDGGGGGDDGGGQE
jgi:hypothetical protein